MKLVSVLLLVAAAGSCILSVASTASALGPVDVEIAAKVGGGTSPGIVLPSSGPAFAGPNALGLGLGGRAGVSFMGFYGGVSFMDYLGASQGNESLKTILYGVEAGYNIGISILTLRPQLGVGNYRLTESSPGGLTTFSGQVVSDSYSSNSLYLEPGVTALLSFGLWIVGADGNVLFLVPTGGDNSHPAFTAHGQVGIRF